MQEEYDLVFYKYEINIEDKSERKALEERTNPSIARETKSLNCKREALKSKETKEREKA